MKRRGDRPIFRIMFREFSLLAAYPMPIFHHIGYDDEFLARIQKEGRPNQTAPTSFHIVFDCKTQRTTVFYPRIS